MSDIEHLEKEYNKNIKTITEKKQLVKIRDHKLMGNIIRSRTKWMDEGENPTKYCLNLEKRHYTNQKNILLENKHFYRTVYKANEEIFYYNLNEHV